VVLIQGIAYYRAGLYNDAARIFSLEKSYYSYIWLGLTNRKMEENDKSVSFFEKAHKINPLDPVVLANLAEAYRLKGQSSKSKIFLEQAHSIDAGNPDILNNLAIYQLQDGRYQRSLENFEKALMGNDNPKFRSNYAFCLFELGRIDEAVDNWEKSLSELKDIPENEPVFLDAQAGLAIGEYTLGKTALAISHYRQVMSKNSEYGKIDLLKNEFLWPERIRSKAAELIEIIVN
jgi:tetratricopeptide (TPR) repeat protein